MKKFFGILLTLFASLCFYSNGYAQVTVTATAGNTGLVSYATLKGAFDAINAGTHKGVVMVLINASTSEPTTAELLASQAPADYSSVIVRPGASVTVSGNFPGPLVKLNGATHVSFDGRIGGSGTTRSLLFVNYSTSNAAGTSTIDFTNGSSNNSMEYLLLSGSSKPDVSPAATVLIESSGKLAISNNDIGAAGADLPSYAVYSTGNPVSSNVAISVSNNLIHDFFAPGGTSSGIFADQYNTGWTVSGNHLYQTAQRSATAAITHSAIKILGGTGHSISNNFIGGNSMNAGGSAYTINGNFNNAFHPISVSLGTASASTIDGNTISNIILTSTPAANAVIFSAIRVLAGNVKIGTNAGNIVGDATGNGSITINASGSSASIITGISSGITAGTGHVVDVKNNQVGAITVNGTGSGLVTMRLFESLSAGSSTLENNNWGGTSNNSIQLNTPNATTVGMYILQTQSADYFLTANRVRNISNNGTGTGTADITGMHVQATQPDIETIVHVANNEIYNLNSPSSTATIGAVRGMFITLTTGVLALTNADIHHNLVYNLNSASSSSATTVFVRGIHVSAAVDDFLNINFNTVHSLTSAAGNTGASLSVAVNGIATTVTSNAQPGATYNVNDNLVYDLKSTSSATTHVMGVGVFYGGSNATIERNKVYNLNNPNTTAGTVTGILARGYFVFPPFQGKFTIANNMISLAPASCQAYGIQMNSEGEKVNVWHNSVYISGNASGAANSVGFFRNGAAVNVAVDIKNNIFHNERTGGTGGQYAMMNNNTSPVQGWLSNNNDLYTSDAAKVVLWGSTPSTLAAYQSASAQDANSVVAAVNFTNVSVADLHLAGASLTNTLLKGTTLADINNDFDLQVRDATTPMMGADEPCFAPDINTNPVAQSICEENSVTFSADASGTGLHYQWQKYNSDISGAMSSTLTINGASLSDAGVYKLIVTGTCGNVESNEASLQVTAKTRIVMQPAAPSVACISSALTLSVQANGSNLGYQWQKFGVNIPGANSSSYTIQHVNPTYAGMYTVTVTGDCGTVNSEAVAVTVGACHPNPNKNKDVPVITLISSLGSSQVILRVQSSDATKFDWKVMNFYGMVVMQGTIQLLPGQTDIPLNLSQLSTGTYYIGGTTKHGVSNVAAYVKQ